VALHVWFFECTRCHESFLFCTRCLNGRKYCDRCAKQVHAESSCAAGSRYQRAPNGRRNHMLRQRRYRARGRERRRESRGPTDASPASVTHQPSNALSSVGATVTRAPSTAAYVASLRGAERDGNETKRPVGATANTVDGEGEASAPICHGEHNARSQDAREAAEREVARVLAQLRCSRPGDRPVMAVCCGCGRSGEVVAYEGRPRVIRGDARCPDSG